MLCCIAIICIIRSLMIFHAPISHLKVPSLSYNKRYFLRSTCVHMTDHVFFHHGIIFCSFARYNIRVLLGTHKFWFGNPCRYCVELRFNTAPRIGFFSTSEGDTELSEKCMFAEVYASYKSNLRFVCVPIG